MLVHVSNSNMNHWGPIWGGQPNLETHLYVCQVFLLSSFGMIFLQHVWLPWIFCRNCGLERTESTLQRERERERKCTQKAKLAYKKYSFSGYHPARFSLAIEHGKNMLDTPRIFDATAVTFCRWHESRSGKNMKKQDGTTAFFQVTSAEVPGISVKTLGVVNSWNR